MNVVNYAKGNYIIPLGSAKVISGDMIYTNVSAVARLLNGEEIDRLHRIVADRPDIEATVYEEIVSLCLIDIIGIPDGAPIDLDKSGAGVVDTIAKTVMNLSMSHIANVKEKVEYYYSLADAAELMAAVVSKYTSTPYDDVISYPINKLMRRYAICAKAFPNEVSMPTEEAPSGPVSSPIGAND